MTDIDPAYAAGLASDGLVRFMDSAGDAWLIQPELPTDPGKFPERGVRDALRHLRHPDDVDIVDRGRDD